MKKLSKQHTPLQKVLKLYIRKIASKDDIKKTILFNFTYKKTLKYKNVTRAVGEISQDLQNSWKYLENGNTNYFINQHNNAQDHLLNSIFSKNNPLGRLKEELPSLHLTFMVVNSLFTDRVDTLKNEKSPLNIKWRKIESSIKPAFKYTRRVLESHGIYHRHVLHDRQFTTLKFNKLVFGVRVSLTKTLKIIANFYKDLKTKDIAYGNLVIKDLYGTSIEDTISSLGYKFNPWAPLDSKSNKSLFDQLTSEFHNYNNSTEYASHLLTASYRAKPNLIPTITSSINKNCVILAGLYTSLTSRRKMYTQGLIQDEVLKLTNPALLILNFRKSRFFPSLTNLKGRLFSTMSLGMFSKFFNKGKSFIKNKSVFLLIAGFLRKLILFSEIQGAMLLIKRVPLYFKEILSALHDPVVGFYTNPFTGFTLNESDEPNTFKFTSFMFINNKPYGKVKNKQKGRLKRKITKRLISINRMVD